MSKIKTKIRKADLHSKVAIVKTIATISFHAKKRFAERVMGIPWGDSPVKYVQDNDLKIYRQMKAKLQNAELLYENYRAYENANINHIYICDDILFFFSADYILTTVWKIKHQNNYKIDYQYTIKRHRRILNYNKSRIAAIENRLKRLGHTQNEYKFAIEQLKQLMESTELDSIEERINLLTNLNDSLVFECETLSEEKRGYVSANKNIMSKILYRFVN